MVSTEEQRQGHRHENYSYQHGYNQFRQTKSDLAPCGQWHLSQFPIVRKYPRPVRGHARATWLD
jgi:hypothetical protein